MRNDSKSAVDVGLKYVNNDACIETSGIFFYFKIKLTGLNIGGFKFFASIFYFYLGVLYFFVDLNKI